jgi:hypothetical protein
MVLDSIWGAVRSAARETLVKQQTGTSDYEWWTKLSPLLGELYADEFAARTPIASRVGPVVGEAYGARADRRNASRGSDDYLVYFVIQASTSWCHILEFAGLSTQWFSSGKYTNFEGTPLRCNAVNVDMPCVSTTR